MNASEVLNKAADLVETRGWTVDAKGWPGYVGSTEDAATSPVCIEGAIIAALGLDASVEDVISGVDLCPAGLAVREYLNIGQHGYMFMWNDTPGRTAAEVIEVLRAAAVIEAAKESAVSPAPVEVGAR